MTTLTRLLVGCAAALLIGAGCAGGGARSQGTRGPIDNPNNPFRAATIPELQFEIQLMLSFDANRDGMVTRDELEAGLKQQFDAADTNHDGHLDLKEMQAENDRRWRMYGTASSPLIDWNQDGVVDFDEFATTARSVFAELDRDRGGTLAGAELRVPVIRGGPRRGPVAQDRPG
jgi:EF hand domain-containing protein